MKVVWHQSMHQSSKLMCNRLHKIELKAQEEGTHMYRPGTTDLKFDPLSAIP